MDCAHTGQNEVKHHEELHLAGVIARVAEVQSRNQVLFVVLVIFQEFNSQEQSRDQFSDDEVADQLIVTAALSGMNRKSHEQAAAQQHRRVQASQQYTQLIAAFRKAS